MIELQVHRDRNAADGNIRIVEGCVCDDGRSEQDGRSNQKQKCAQVGS